MSTWTDQNQSFINLPLDKLLTIVTYGEAGNQGAEGMMGVLNVIRNRTLDQQFYDNEIYGMTGNSYKSVILKKWQFSMFNLDDPVRPKAENWAINFDNYVASNSAFRQAYELSEMVIGGTLSDNTGGATYYLNPDAVTKMPQWASVIPFLGQIGDHVFFGEGISAVGEAATAAYQTIEESAIEAIGVMKEHSNISILVLAGLGAGLLLILTKKKR
jgi:hypothetical protein